MVQLRLRGLRTFEEPLDSPLLPEGEFEPTNALAAASNTALSPCCVNAEHSEKDVAWISSHSLEPCSFVMGFNPFFVNSSNTFGSVLKSYLVPTNTIGVSGQ